jgi:tol-pal system protein YbgF
VAQQARPAPQPKASPAAPSESGLARRVEQLEEQLVDMQVQIGTLESLARGTTAPAGNRGAPNAALSGADAGRLDGIETQIRALAAQLEQLQEQIRAMPRRSGDLGLPVTTGAADQPTGPRPGRPPSGTGPAPERTGFGATVVTAPEEKEDEIGKILDQQGQQPGQRVAAAPIDPDVSPKQMYEQAHGFLLQRDYGAAETAFDEFLRRFPNDPLASYAQYWLGESLYFRGQYRAAAAAYLKGYQNYGKSAKAPEALLKLGMSLQRLGQKDAACNSFSELTAKYPSAPPHVKSTVTAERQRAGCS